MSNIIINKDRWQEKPKSKKTTEYQSNEYHKIKDKMLSDGYTLEEVDIYFKSLAKDIHNKQKKKSDDKIKELVLKHLSTLSDEQISKIIKTINDDFQTKKLEYIEKYLIKVANIIEKDDICK
ncbi:hypothetical protein [Aliarcobacter cryaerophilus]|uniref:hypothetical protein n=1 Tax=Aliarcobacter cryaerophilus TaxID=28198 RepID=UPI0021B685AB|nr:hypothetical protein [Aliarcobacter cryaerophilus]MCT7482536.1 hypothetical protein [Aliarcobacter cryaerophilus]